MNYIQKFFSKFATIKVSERNTISFTVNEVLYKIMPILCSILIILYFCPFTPSLITGHLDPSWRLFINSINELDSKVTEKMNDYQISDAVTEIFNVLRASNKYIDDTTPWILAKDEASKDRLETVIYNLLESIRVCAIMIKPFMPETSDKILSQINNDNNSFGFTVDNEYQLNTPEVLFQRIDKEKFLAEM